MVFLSRIVGTPCLWSVASDIQFSDIRNEILSTSRKQLNIREYHKHNKVQTVV